MKKKKCLAAIKVCTMNSINPRVDVGMAIVESLSDVSFTFIQAPKQIADKQLAKLKRK
jgi:hypothetical protein